MQDKKTHCDEKEGVWSGSVHDSTFSLEESLVQRHINEKSQRWRCLQERVSQSMWRTFHALSVAKEQIGFYDDFRNK